MPSPLLFWDQSCINAGMGNISSAFQDALAAQAKAALVDVVATNPRITVKDIAELVANNPQLGSLTLDELLGESEGGRGRGGRRKAGAAAGPAGAAGGAGARKLARKDGAAHKRNVRTETGRECGLGVLRDMTRAHTKRIRVWVTPACLFIVTPIAGTC